MQTKLLYQLSLVIIFSLLVTCEEKEDDPLYVGTWTYFEKIDVQSITYNTTRTLILGKSSFEDKYVIVKDNTSDIVTILGLKGTISVSGTKMTFTLKEIGACKKDASDKCTSEVQYYGEGTAYYNNEIQFYRKIFEAEYEVDEDYLYVVGDKNGDGDTEDAGEDVEYERSK